MVELFELIARYPIEFLAGLGISTTTIYTGVRIIKGIVALITKKSRIAKEKLQQDNIATAIITKLGGIDGFIDKVASSVIEKLTTSKSITEIKEILTKVATRSDCPIELKAYIETVLSQSGSEELYLQYENAKSTLLAVGKNEIEEVIEQGSNIIESEQNTEPAQPVVEDSPKQEVVIENQPITNKDEDIEYA